MPMPVSVTETITALSPNLASTLIRPPSGVNFTALDSRLTRHLLYLALVAGEVAEAVVDDTFEFDPMTAGTLAHEQERVLDGVRQVKRRHFQLHPPGLDLGQIEDVVDQRQQMASGGQECRSVYSSCFSFSSPNNRSSNTSEKPMIALSGVRSSCDTLARNSDLWRLAASICRPLSSISRNSRAFWIARADWRGEGLQEIHNFGRKAAGFAPADRQRSHDLLLEKSGTARSER